MIFVKVEDLKVGMRLARPIYSKKGVLLYERNSKLTIQGIDSVRNFGLLGIYVLEPAEPLPPMSEEDLEFERFQTMCIFLLKEEVEKILGGEKQNKLLNLINMLIKRYGYIDGKSSFYQNLRSKDDYVYRHSLNVAILCAMMAKKLGMRMDEQVQVVGAALLHDIGRISVMDDRSFTMNMDMETQRFLLSAQNNAADLIESSFSDGGPVRRICMQALKVQVDDMQGNLKDGMKLVLGAKILLVANRYDEITAMDLEGNTESEVKALYEFMEKSKMYDFQVVDALTDSIKILFPGVSIVLSTGEKALVIKENPENVLRPVVLTFEDNSVIDLSLRVNYDIRIVDIMKTLDNRYIIDEETLRQAGYLQ